MVSASFLRYQLEVVVKQAIVQHIAVFDARFEREEREEERSTRLYVTDTVLGAKRFEGGRYTIGSLSDEMEGTIHTITWGPGPTSRNCARRPDNGQR